jgi:hypothetical protein
MKRIAAPGQWDAYIAAREAVRPLLMAGGPDYTVQDVVAASRHDAALDALFESVLDKWERGKLELYGRRGDPTAPAVPIPSSARPDLLWYLAREQIKVNPTGMLIYSVRFRQVASLAETAQITESQKLGLTTEPAELKPSKVWIREEVAKIAAGKNPPKGITELAKRLFKLQSKLSVKPMARRSIENFLRDQKLWPL